MKFVLPILLFSVNLFSSECVLRIGTNLAGPSDWGSEWPFVNIMKYSRQWITFNSAWVNGGKNPWDTGVLDRIPLDKNGYPLELPFRVAGTETTQVVRTVWANTFSLKEGRYVVLYDGIGKVNVGFDAKLYRQAPGRIEFDLKRKDNIFSLEILESQRGNHVRNIRVLLPGTESTYEQNPWCSEWLEKLEPFKVLRFMDWGYTNNSTLRYWNERPQIDDYTYTLRGVPYEWMIELCNLKGADAWVCVPHLADEEYVRNMARLFRDRLRPDVKIYVEYSNEIWNWMFAQTQYVNIAGDQTRPWPERIVPFIQRALDWWSDEFAGQLDRLVRVVGVQHAWQDVSNRIVFNMRPGSFDAFSPAAYFGFSERGYAALEKLGAAATAEDVLFWAREGMLSDSYKWTKDQFNSIAKKLNLPMIYYEGGQHLTPNPFGSDQPYNSALTEAQTHPGMYDLYCEWFDSLRTFVLPGKTALLMNFSFIGPKSGKYGSWGALESQFDQFPPYRQSAPKYQALLDNLCEPSTEIRKKVERNGFDLLPAFPNPFNSETFITFFLPEEKRVQLEIIDSTGRLVTRLADLAFAPGRHVFRWDAAEAASGVFFVRLKTEDRVLTRKCLLIR
ncbi:MAG: T9SS type A sorting domain-containing protein [candidate division KSB1 bacterium]|nr:T9SS type A sorting domain-containing protein [candidate division KSB1 bacterium]